jgi:hypothetical protein
MLDQLKAEQLQEGYDPAIIKEALGIGGKTVIGEPGSSTYSRAKLNKVIDPSVSKAADHSSSSTIGTNAKPVSKASQPSS